MKSAGGGVKFHLGISWQAYLRRGVTTRRDADSGRARWAPRQTTGVDRCALPRERQCTKNQLLSTGHRNGLVPKRLTR